MSRPLVTLLLTTQEAATLAALLDMAIPVDTQLELPAMRVIRHKLAGAQRIAMGELGDDEG